TLGTGAFVTKVSNPLHGTATLNADGSFTYQAAPGFNGTDSFTYTVTDDAGAVSNVATVTLTGFSPGSVNPDATDTDGTTPVTVDVLATDTAPPGTSLVPRTVAVPVSPLHGTVTINRSTGAITYTAAANFTGTDSFRYTVGFSNGVTSAQTLVSVRVNRPVAAD